MKDLKPVLILPALSTLAVGAVMAWVVTPPLILGGMAAFDMGGPVNKVAGLFALYLLASGVAEPMGALLVLGLLNIAEGTIPLLLADPRRVVPAVTAGGAVAGAIAMALGER